MSIVRVLLMVTGTPLALGLILFPTAGDLTWRNGWVFLLVFVGINVLVVPYIWRVNPELLLARSRFRWEKGWDKALSSVLIPAVMAIFVVAALDDGRFHWHPIPGWVCGIGYLHFVSGLVALTWVGAVNKFAEPTVRIQTERGHTVIDCGPYAMVRHPSYLIAIAWFAGIALCLGSLWALIPAALAGMLLIVRTKWEDETLQAELPGYKDYTEKVRYKLIPGVW
jgi:protein-S-isoprenylcysteine O-methyltransferase Ste14